MTLTVDARACAWRDAGLLLVPIACPPLVERQEDPHHRYSEWTGTLAWAAFDAAALTLLAVGALVAAGGCCTSADAGEASLGHAGQGRGFEG